MYRVWLEMWQEGPRMMVTPFVVPVPGVEKKRTPGQRAPDPGRLRNRPNGSIVFCVSVMIAPMYWFSFIQEISFASLREVRPWAFRDKKRMPGGDAEGFIPTRLWTPRQGMPCAHDVWRQGGAGGVGEAKEGGGGRGRGGG